MKVKFTIGGKQATAKEAVSALLHPDQLAERVLMQKAAAVSCDQHPIQCRELAIKVSGGKATLENVCCDAFREKVLQALKTQDAASPTQQS